MVGTDCQGANHMTRGLELSGLSPRHPGRREGLEVESTASGQ